MKKLLLTLALAALFSFNSSAKGIPMPICTDCEYITIVENLPDSADYFSEEYNGYIDLAYKYEQLWVLWVPIWNSNGTYCYSIKGKDVYFDISEEELKAIEEEFGYSLSSNPIPFWDKIGGKLLLILIAGGIAWSYLKPSKD